MGRESEENDSVLDSKVDPVNAGMRFVSIVHEKKMLFRMASCSSLFDCLRYEAFLEPLKPDFIISPAIIRCRNPSEYCSQ